MFIIVKWLIINKLIINILICFCIDKTGKEIVMDEKNRISLIHKLMALDRLHHACVDKSINSLGFDLHRTQHMTLMYLSKVGGAASQKQIADEFNVSPAAVATLLKQLEAKGYVERRQDSADTRRNLVQVSEKGLDVVKKSHEKFTEADANMTKGLSQEELESLEKIIDKMKANMCEFAASAGVEVRR